MKEKFIGTWKAAFFESPGPVTVKKAVSLALKGICMGSADVIPGVSGGTIALITGIYEDLIAALRSLDLKVVRKIFHLDIKGALADVHIRFLLTLFSDNQDRRHDETEKKTPYRHRMMMKQIVH